MAPAHRLAAPLVNAVQRAGPGRFHDSETVYRASDGAPLWNLRKDAGIQPPPLWRVSVAGEYFFFHHDHAVRFEQITTPR